MAARRQPNPHSESVDDYLKAILALSEPAGRRVNSSALANRLGVAPASVTNMLQKLAASSSPLVEYERHRGVLLSAAGKRRALEVLRHHRLIETFLYQVLDYPIEEIHEDAERLEHFISERFEERIAAKLGNPKLDPHGHCIPAMDGTMSQRNSVLLAEILEPGEFTIESVADDDAALLKGFKNSGIAPDVRLRVVGLDAVEGYSVRIGKSSKVTAISNFAAGAIRISIPQE